MSKGKKLKKWQELPIGGVITDPGNSTSYRTGGWNAREISFDQEKCIHCGICWSVCPDSAIIFKDEKMEGIDDDHCKKCGICEKACPTKCFNLKQKERTKI